MSGKREREALKEILALIAADKEIDHNDQRGHLGAAYDRSRATLGKIAEIAEGASR